MGKPNEETEEIKITRDSLIERAKAVRMPDAARMIDTMLKHGFSLKSLDEGLNNLEKSAASIPDMRKKLENDLSAVANDIIEFVDKQADKGIEIVTVIRAMDIFVKTAKDKMGLQMFDHKDNDKGGKNGKGKSPE